MRHPGIASYIVPLTLVFLACAAPPAKQRTTRYPSGAVQWEYTALRGIPHGPSTTWHENGKPRSAGSYDNGKKDGLFRYYDVRGELERQIFYERGVERWSSTDPNGQPPEYLVGREPETDDNVRRPDVDYWKNNRPRRAFATLDRSTPGDRAGIALAWGARDEVGDVGIGTSLREVFGSVGFGAYDVYGQAAASSLQREYGAELRGRRTLEVGVARHFALPRTLLLSTRTGVLVPLGRSDVEGVVATAESAYARAPHAAAGFSADAALRTSASLSKESDRFVLQVDCGVDWLVGGHGSQSPIGALARFNGALGINAGPFIAAAEIANAMLLSDSHGSVRSLGLSGTLFIGELSLTVAATMANDSHTSFLTSTSYAF